MFFQFKPFHTSAEHVFKDPDVGKKYQAKSRAELVNQIVQYRAQNELPQIAHLNTVLDTYQCLLPENAGKCMPLGKLKRGLRGYVKGGIALLKNLTYNSYASQEVAEKRAEQCIKCPFNVFPDKDGFVEWADSIAADSVGDRKTPFNEGLGNCAVCTCVLKAKVFYNGTVDPTPEEVENYKKVNCWQLDLIK